MNKYGLHGKLTATAGNGDKLASILLEAAKLVSTAKGCYVYMVSKDHSDEDAVWVTEAWDSNEYHDNPLQVAGVKNLSPKPCPS